MIPTVITSWSNEGFKEYGRTFQRTFAEHWSDVPLEVVTEARIMDNRLVAAVLAVLDADPDTNRRGDLHRGAAKWARKVFALSLAASGHRDWIIWIDGDVEFLKPPTEAFFHAVCPTGRDVSFLGRPWTYASETGFVAYNMASPRTRMLLAMMRDVYLTGYFRDKLKSWTDGAVFDWCRNRLGPGLKENDLCFGLRPENVEQGGLHVWPSTVLAEFCRHNKGPRRRKAAYA